MRPEPELIARAARGDREAFDALAAPRWARINQLARRIIGQAEDAQDVAQQVLLRLWQVLPRFRAGAELDGWIYRMTVNLAIDALRRRQARPDNGAAEIPASLAGGGPGPEDQLLARELERVLQEVTRALPPRQKAVFILAQVEGKTAPEIAEILGVAPSTVRNHLLHVRSAVVRRLRERFPGFPGLAGPQTGE